MANGPQGRFFCPGLQDYDNVQMSFCAHGTEPSTIVVSTYPQNIIGIPQQPFDATFVYENTRVTFNDCIVDAGQCSFGAGGTRVNLRILDHRWRWANWHKLTTFHVNRRIPGTKKLVRGSRLVPREIVSRLMQAAGEQRFDISLVPGDDYPEVEVTGTNPPMMEIENLISQYGLRVCYQPMQRGVKIVRNGQGRPLPPGSVFPAVTLNPADPPSKIVVIGDDVLFQCRWHLRAMAEKEKGVWCKLDDAPYKPTDGWKNINPQAVRDYIEAEHGEEKAALAEGSVYRSYQIVSTEDARRDAQTDLAPWIKELVRDRDGNRCTVNQLDQVLPIAQNLTEMEKLPDGTERAKQGKVTGKFCRDIIDSRSDKKNTKGEPKDVYPAGFSLNGELGIVQFSDPVYILDDNDRARGPFKPAELMFECTFNVRAKQDEPRVRVSWEARVSNNQSGIKTFHRPQLTRVCKFNGRAVDDGIQEVNRIGRVLESEIRSQFISQRGEVALYNSLIAPEPDGALQQYEIAVGTSGCTTQVSRNCESSMVSPSFAVRRRIALSRSALEL